jgi:hypothetical protein
MEDEDAKKIPDNKTEYVESEVFIAWLWSGCGIVQVLVRTETSEVSVAPIFRIERIPEFGAALTIG